VPSTRSITPSAKAPAAVDDDAAVDGAACELARSLRPGHTYLIGPGTSTTRVLRHLGLAGSLLGVDVVRDGRLVARDANARVLAAAATGATLVAGVIGGQGFLLGRGNQQLTPAIIDSLDDIVVLAGAHKLATLPDRCLHVDTGDAATDAGLTGYRRVRTAPGRTMVVRVA
jgi:predicted polyphosphate/ATP-dependent NAD kinase